MPTPNPGAEIELSTRTPATPAQVALIDKLCKQLKISRKYRCLTKRLAGYIITELMATRDAATPAQIGFVTSLRAQHGLQIGNPETLTRTQASEEINRLKVLPRGDAESLPDPAARVLKVAEEGMYRTPDGDIYKVQLAIHGSGRPYAKRMVEVAKPQKVAHGVRTHEFVFESGALSKLTADMKMTLEQAKEWGALYGTCCRCGITLTNEESIARGLGPICADRW